MSTALSIQNILGLAEPAISPNPPNYTHPTWMTLPTCPVGIEIEVENAKKPLKSLSWWSVKPDQSLRNNGLEFITKPVYGYSLEKALAELTSVIVAENTKAEFTDRCSVHVHMWAGDLTTLQLYKFIITYIMYENALFKQAAPIRKHNNYCIPLQALNPEAFYDSYMRLYTGSIDIKDLKEACTTFCKYSAVNLSRLSSFSGTPALGTVEFRHLDGTFDVTRLQKWIGIILSLKAATINKKYYGNQLYTRVHDKGIIPFTRKILGPTAVKTLLEPYESSREFEVDVEEGLIIAMYLINKRNIDISFERDHVPKLHKEESLNKKKSTSKFLKTKPTEWVMESGVLTFISPDGFTSTSTP